MKTWRNILFFYAIFSCIVSVNAQELKVTYYKPKSFKEERIEYKQERIEQRTQRQYSREERKAVKAYHKKLQTKKVRKRMKQSRKKAVYNRFNTRPPFYEKWFG